MREEPEHRPPPLGELVRPRVRGVGRWHGDDVDGGVGRGAVARGQVREEDRARRHVPLQEVDQPGRQRVPVVLDLRRPVREAVDGDGQDEEEDGQSCRGPARPRVWGRWVSVAPPREESARDERRDAPVERDPDDDRGLGPRSAQPEVAGKRHLEPDAARQPAHDRERPREAGDDGGAAREGHRERDEPGQAPRLRERDGIGEVREDERPELDPEHRDRPAEHECGPAASPGEEREGHQQEGDDRHRSVPVDAGRGEAVPRE